MGFDTKGPVSSEKSISETKWFCLMEAALSGAKLKVFHFLRIGNKLHNKKRISECYEKYEKKDRSKTARRLAN